MASLSPYLERTMHAMVKVQELPNHISEIKLQDDTKISLVIGIVLGLLIIVLLAKFPGKPFDYSVTEDGGESTQRKRLVGDGSEGRVVGTTTEIMGGTSQDLPASAASPSVDDILADEDRLLASKNLSRASKALGLSDEQVRQAIRQARSDLQKGPQASDALYEHGSLSGKVDLVFYVVALSALFYFLNRDYGNVASHWLRQAFPREAAVLFGPADEL